MCLAVACQHHRGPATARAEPATLPRSGGHRRTPVVVSSYGTVSRCSVTSGPWTHVEKRSAMGHSGDVATVLTREQCSCVS